MQFSVRTLRTIAGRISGLKQDAAADERELAKLIGELAPQLLRQPGIPTVLAAEIYNAWSHPGRIARAVPVVEHRLCYGQIGGRLRLTWGSG